MRATDPRSRLLRWTADVEDDLAGPDRLRVFVPTVMGAGLLVSLVILLGDVVRRVRPDRTGRRRIQQRAIALVTPVARAIGAPPPSLGPIRYRLRSTRAYLVISAASLGASLYVAIGSAFNYNRRGGYLAGIEWVLALALVASAVLLGLAVVAATIAARAPAAARWTRPFIEHTLLGAREV